MAYKNPEDQRKYQIAWRKRNPDKTAEYNQRNYDKHRELYLIRAKKWNAENPGKRAANWQKWSYGRRLELKYGLTIEQFEEMLHKQNYCCAICREPFSSPRNRHVDHCHDTGVVRGILCQKCNLAIGLLQNSPTVALEAAHYLNQSTQTFAPTQAPQQALAPAQ